MLEMEALLLDLMQHRAVLPEFARDASYAERDELLLRKPLGVLNDALAGRDYLVGNSFTVGSQRGGHSRVGKDGPTEFVGSCGGETVA